MRRKVPGGVKPRNTLNQLGPSTSTLPTVTYRGQNVSAGSVKRQKTSHVFPEDYDDDKPGDGFFNRGLQGRTPASLGRQQSVSVTSIHSQEALSQRSDLFGHNEARDMHRVLNASKKTGRKPKSGPTQHSSPPLYGAITDPVPVDDDDDIQLLGEDNNTPRLARHRAVQRPPRSPPLADTFVRINDEPEPVPETRGNQSKIRNKMQSASNISRTLQASQVVDDLSEDELSREPTVQSSAQKTRKTVTLRSPSPNDIVSTHFTNKRKKPEERENLSVHLSSLRMMAGNWEDLYLIYSWAHKGIQFTWNGEMLRGKSGIIQLSHNHASTVYCSLERSKEVILQGSKGDFSRGRIWFKFDTTVDRDIFLDAIKNMSSKVQLKDLEE